MLSIKIFFFLVCVIGVLNGCGGGSKPKPQPPRKFCSYQKCYGYSPQYLPVESTISDNTCITQKQTEITKTITEYVQHNAQCRSNEVCPSRYRNWCKCVDVIITSGDWSRWFKDTTKVKCEEKRFQTANFVRKEKFHGGKECPPLKGSDFKPKVETRAC